MKKIILLIFLIFSFAISFSNYWAIKLEYKSDTIYELPFINKCKAFVLLKNYSELNENDLLSLSFNLSYNKNIIDSNSVKIVNKSGIKLITNNEKLNNNREAINLCFMSLNKTPELNNNDTLIEVNFNLKDEIKNNEFDTDINVLEIDYSSIRSALTSYINTKGEFKPLYTIPSAMILKAIKGIGENENIILFTKDNTNITIALMPNPSRGKFYVHYDEEHFGNIIYTRIVDIYGNVIINKKPKSNPELFTIPNVISGIYFVNTLYEENIIKTIPIQVVTE